MRFDNIIHQKTEYQTDVFIILSGYENVDNNILKTNSVYTSECRDTYRFL